MRRKERRRGWRRDYVYVKLYNGHLDSDAYKVIV